MSRQIVFAIVGVVLCSATPAAARAGTTDALGRDPAVTAAISRAVNWLAGVQIDPFAEGAASLRMYTMEIETRHRVWLLEKDAGRRTEYETVLRNRLAQVLDSDRLIAALEGEGGTGAFTEVAVLADRCRQHAVDAGPLVSALSARREALRAEVERVPPSVKLLYAVYLPSAGIDLGLSTSALRAKGMLATRPSEVDLTLADVYYLTHEIFSYSDYCTRPLLDLSEPERLYLLRVLPFFTVFYAAWNNLDIVGELLTCLWAANMRATFAYEEGVRVLLERQNPDGSFGGPDARTLDRPVKVEEVLHPTMNCLTALMLDAGGL